MPKNVRNNQPSSHPYLMAKLFILILNGYTDSVIPPWLAEQKVCSQGGMTWTRWIPPIPPSLSSVCESMFLKWDRWSCQRAVIPTYLLLSGPWQPNNTPCQSAHTYPQINRNGGHPEVHSSCCVCGSVCQPLTSRHVWCSVWPETLTSFPSLSCVISRLPCECVCVWAMLQLIHQQVQSKLKE